MSLNLKLDQIKALIGQIETQILELEEHKSKVCSTKARSLLQKVKMECHDLRAECLQFVKSLKTPVETPEEKLEEIPEEKLEETSVAPEEKPKKKPKKKVKAST